MAIYHLNVGKGSKSVGAKSAGKGASRGAGAKGSGASGGASAKYDYLNRAEKYNSSRGGRDEVLYSESGNMPSWASEKPKKYWVSGDEFERKNGVVFREVEFALPIELNENQREKLARSFAKELATTKDGQLPYSFAIHKGKETNPHVHVMLSERVNDGYDRSAETWFKRAAASPKGRKLDPASGGAKKTTELRGDWLERTRELWAIRANEALEKANISDRIDHRSNEARGLNTKPSKHLGPIKLAIQTKNDGLIQSFITDKQENSVREEWRMVKKGETVVGPVREIITLNQSQYLVIAGGPNADRSAQRMIVVRDSIEIAVGQKFYATEKDGKFLYKPDMLKRLMGKGLSR